MTSTATTPTPAAPTAVTGDAAPRERPRRLVTVAAAEIAPAPVAWLWAGRFAFGKLGLVIGDPDLGKSLMTLDMAARVSRGLPWPDGAPCDEGEVLLVTAEDAAADTIRPRLEAAGADLARVHLHRATAGGRAEIESSGFSLKHDLAALADWLAAHKAVRLVIFDPLGAHAGGADTHRDSDVRALLAPFGELAERARAAVIGIVHLNKRLGGRALYRASGSLAFVAAARHVYAVGRDPLHERRRLLARVKNNLSRDESGMAYRVESAANGHPRLIWEPKPVRVSAETLMQGEPEATRIVLTEAGDWLLGQLASGPMDASDLRDEANDDGVPWRNVERAKARLGIVARRNAASRWVWVLPRDKAGGGPRPAPTE